MVDGFFEDFGREDDLDFEVETQGEISSKDAESTGGGKSVSKEGFYHCMVKAVKKEKPEERKDWKPLTESEKAEGKKEQCPYRSPSISLTFEILQGDHGDQIGLSVYHRCYLWRYDDQTGKFVLRTGKDLKFISQIAYGLGIITKEELDSGKLRLNFGGIEGRQCVVEVRKKPPQPGDAREYFEIPFGNVWKPESKPDVKKDAEAMAIHISGAGMAEAASPNLF